MTIEFFNLQKKFLRSPSFSSGLTELISFLFFKGMRICFLLQGSSKISFLGCEQILYGKNLLL